MWVKHWLACPDCKNEVAYIRIYFEGQIRIMLEGYCRHCKKMVNLEVSCIQATTAIMRWEKAKHESKPSSS